MKTLTMLQLRTPQKLAQRTTRGLDAMALTTLFGTGELTTSWLLIIGSLALLAFWVRARRVISRGILTAALLAVVFGAVALALGVTGIRQAHPILITAQAAPLVLALIWFSAPTLTQYYSRLALGFLQIAIASAISPDLSIAIGIFVFFVLAGIQLTALHLWGQFEAHCRVELRRPIPRRVLFFGFATSIVILAGSVLIFPFLPRLQSQWSGPMLAGDLTQIGYSEQIELGTRLKWLRSGSSSEEEPALRIFLGSTDWDVQRLLFPSGLLKMRVYSQWSKDKWVPSADRWSKPSASPPASIALQAIREPLASDSLPVPYSGEAVRITSENTGIWMARQSEGLIKAKGLRDKRVAFQLKLTPGRMAQLGTSKDPSALPGREDLWVPTEAGTLIREVARWKSLSKRVIGGPGSSTLEKMRKLNQFFRDAGFRAELVDSLEDGDQPRARTTLDRFLFERRKGHCQWFSGAALVLLRMQGVPTRLVSGFRISRSPFGGVLTIPQKDAHLWLEAWDAKTASWLAFDPTPRIQVKPSFFEELMDLYQGSSHWASSQWYRWVLSPKPERKPSLIPALPDLPEVPEHKEWTQAGRWAELFKKFLKEHQALFVVTMLALAFVLSRLALRILRWARGLHWSRRSPRVLSRRFRFALKRSRISDPSQIKIQQTLLRLRFSNLQPGSADFASQFKGLLESLDRLLDNP